MPSPKKIEKLLNKDFEKQRKEDEREGWKGQWFKVRFLRVTPKLGKIQFRLLSGKDAELMDPFDEVMKLRGFTRIGEQEIGDLIAQVFTRQHKTYEFLQKMP